MPNPASDKVEVYLKYEEEGKCRVQLQDILGHTIMNTSFDARERKTMLNTSSLAAGVYLVQVRKEGGWLRSEKLIISK